MFTRYTFDPDPDHTVEAIRTLMAYKRAVKGENGMWYNRKKAEKVFARRLGRRESISFHKDGYETASDKNVFYREGDYIVYEPEKGIYFMKAQDFKNEFDTTIE